MYCNYETDNFLYFMVKSAFHPLNFLPNAPHQRLDWRKILEGILISTNYKNLMYFNIQFLC